MATWQLPGINYWPKMEPTVSWVCHPWKNRIVSDFRHQDSAAHHDYIPLEPFLHYWHCAENPLLWWFYRTDAVNPFQERFMNSWLKPHKKSQTHEMHGPVLNNVTTDALVLKHQWPLLLRKLTPVTKEVNSRCTGWWHGLPMLGDAWASGQLKQGLTLSIWFTCPSGKCF